LSVGSILLAWWLIAVAAGGQVFAATHAFLASPIGAKAIANTKRMMSERS